MNYMRKGEVLTAFPSSPEPGDEYITKEYIYKYKYSYYESFISFTDSLNRWQEFPDFYPDGWGVTTLGGEKGKYDEDLLDEILGKPVLILDYLFVDNSFLEKAPKIPKYAISANFMFANCCDLKSPPIFPETIKSMRYTFYNCSDLEINMSEFKFPDALEDASHCFTQCYNIEKIPSLPDNLRRMDYMFSDCISLTVPPRLPKNVVFADSAFADCSKMAYAPVLPDSLQDMNNMFQDCKNMTSYSQSQEADGSFSKYKLPSNLKSIYHTFANCNGMVVSPKIPEGVQEMKYTFAYCINLKFIQTLPDTVINIEGMCHGCKNLKKIPGMSSKIENFFLAFADCEKLSGKFCIDTDFEQNGIKTYDACFHNAGLSIGSIEVSTNRLEPKWIHKLSLLTEMNDSVVIEDSVLENIRKNN